MVGDFNGDHSVDLIDFARLTEHWLDLNCGLCDGIDTNDDGTVDLLELVAMVENWLKVE
jgi:hypothetical protein